jgi:Putative transposase/Transposase zinc-binding domain
MREAARHTRRCSLQDIFRDGFAAYAEGHRLHSRETRAARCISQCHTTAMGAHALVCPEGHYQRLQTHACRHRSCPRCAAPARAQWIDAQLARLLPCPHFHAVFTLPHELLPLWSFNREALSNLLFDCARRSLLQLMADPKCLGALPGVLMSLHTWGRTLCQHPHLHCLVTAGGLDPEGRWRECPAHIPLSALPLKALFRGKFLAGLGRLLRRPSLAFPPQQDACFWRRMISSLYRKPWHLEVFDPYPNGRGVALYLARYVKGGPLPADRALRRDKRGHVLMPYTDHRDGRSKLLRLTSEEFIGRVLWHAPPRGQHTTRHAGLYRPGEQQLRQHAQQAWTQFSTSRIIWPRPQPGAAPIPAQAQPPSAKPPKAQPCPICHKPLRFTALPKLHQIGEFSLSRAPPHSLRCPTNRSSGHVLAGAGRAQPP